MIALLPADYGCVGDGVTDDTVAFQAALTAASDGGRTLQMGAGKVYLITQPLYLWGGCDLVGDSDATLLLRSTEKYLINAGISGVQTPESEFTGAIRRAKFIVDVDTAFGGRAIYFWRTSDATIADNTFVLGGTRYSATSSGNDNAYLTSGYVRENITIIRNEITATAVDGDAGSEGIGLGQFDGALIENNTVSGVGDDPIGIHQCSNVIVRSNVLTSTHGRIFMANCVDTTISLNEHTRAPDSFGDFDSGISLLYIGFETAETNDFSAPTNIVAQDNVLTYPAGAEESGAGIYVYGPRNVDVLDNTIVCNSNESGMDATAIHLLPMVFTGTWTDPDELDPTDTALVYACDIKGNTASGAYPQEMIMTGNCVDYVGPGVVSGNTASAFTFYCPTAVTETDNEII